MLRILSWNIHQRLEPWRDLLDANVDVALLQEAKEPPRDVATLTELYGETAWHTAGAGMSRPWRTAIARMSDRVTVEPRRLLPVEAAGPSDLAVSRAGTLAVADVTITSTGEVVTVASMYGAWEESAKETGSQWIFADASVHRLISDLSPLIGRQQGHKLIAAGDLNILYGYGEGGSPYWKARYESVFSRMEALGLTFVGPQAPEGGEQASPWPEELPEDSRNVPTYRTRRERPDSATRQLDFVFASKELADRLQVRAMNSVEQWGPSDHCRILIELGNG